MEWRRSVYDGVYTFYRIIERTVLVTHTNQDKSPLVRQMVGVPQ